MSDVFNVAVLNCRMPIRRVLVASGILIGLLSTSLVNAEVYRYEQGGRVTYGDHVPTSGIDDGHSVLSNRGVVLKQVKSREERRIERREKQQADALRLRDKTLLKTFTGEEDLIRTRDDRVGLVDGQLTQLDDRIRLSKDNLGSIDQRIRAGERENGKGNAPAHLYTEKEIAKAKIKKAWTLKDAKTAERKKIETKFESDLERYRWLKSGGK